MTNAGKFANGTLLLAIVGTFLLLLYLGVQQWQAGSGSPLFFGLLVLALLLFLGALRLPLSIKINLSLLLFTFGFTAYALEAFLFFNGNPLDYRTPNFIAARSQGIPFDKRTPLQVMMAARGTGVDANPYIAPNPYFEELPSLAGKAPVYYLGGLSNVTTVHCNESGAFTIYESDRYGFHNPDAVWDGDNLDIVAVGDSFTQGACVSTDENYVSLIRSAYPNTLSLGVSGNGPLSTLATLKEYAAPRKPHTVLWFYFEGNDMGDLMAELTHPVLINYASAEFSQALETRQDEIDAIQRIRIQSIIDARIGGRWRARLDALRLYNTRRLLRLTREPQPEGAVTDNQLAEGEATDEEGTSTTDSGGTISTYFRDDPTTSFETFSPDTIRLSKEETEGHLDYDPVMELGLDRFDLVLRHAHQAVAAWGGELRIVYLPSYQRFSPTDPAPESAYYRPQVLHIIAETEIPLLDLTPAFAAHPDELSLFPLGLDGHYSAAGNALVAEHVLEFLKEQK